PSEVCFRSCGVSRICCCRQCPGVRRSPNVCSAAGASREANRAHSERAENYSSFRDAPGCYFGKWDQHAQREGRRFTLLSYFVSRNSEQSCCDSCRFVYSRVVARKQASWTSQRQRRISLAS